MSDFHASSKIEEYRNHSDANRAIAAEEIRGWTPQSITTHRDGWGDTSTERVLVLYRSSRATLPQADLLNIAMGSDIGFRALREDTPTNAALDVLFDPASEPLSVETLIELTQSDSNDARARAFDALFSQGRSGLTRAQAIELTKSADHKLAEAAAQWLLEAGS